MIAQTYKQIFEARGVKYNDAMEEFPNARDQEFRNALGFISQKDGHRICDIPAAGGYLRRFLKDSVTLVSVEESDDFYRTCPSIDNSVRVKSKLDGDYPIEANSIDAIVSIAGLHHLRSKEKTISEFSRILKKGGELIVADVCEKCISAPWLNTFVHENNSAGHDGIFLDGSFDQVVTDAGLTLFHSAILRYHWNFDSPTSMTKFVRSLFGIDKCSEQDVRDGIEKYLGYRVDDNFTKMNWELKFVYAKKLA